MKQTNVTIRYWSTPDEVVNLDCSAWDFDVPGLVVSRHLGDNDEPRWAVTHVASGLGVGYVFDSPEPAANAITQLAELEVDWTVDADSLLRIEWLRFAVSEITHRCGSTHRSTLPSYESEVRS